MEENKGQKTKQKNRDEQILSSIQAHIKSSWVDFEHLKHNMKKYAKPFNFIRNRG